MKTKIRKEKNAMEIKCNLSKKYQEVKYTSYNSMKKKRTKNLSLKP